MERAYGDGKVVLWTSTLDRAWNRMPDSPGTFVPLVLELVQDLGARFQQERNLAVGSGIELVVDSFPRSATLTSPSGAQRPIEGDSTERPDRRWSLPMLDGSWMESVGVYSVRTESARTEPVAVQFDARESDLTRATALEVEAIHPALRVASVNKGGGEIAPEAAPRRGELWRWLALAALVFLVVESLWGAWIGTRRRFDS